MVQRVVLVQKQKATVLKAFTKPWTLQVLLLLRGGSGTFSELKWKLQVSSKTLSSRLKELTAAGLIERSICADMKLRVEYSLTPKGHELSTIISALDSWETKWA